MTENILVSIITVVFNGAKTLEQTILSVLNQTYSNIEYIIIDGGSKDGTIEIIKKYEVNISYWISEPDDGIYDAMNKGIFQAKGELIGIVNSDDWYENYTVETIVNEYLKSEEKNNTVFYGILRLWQDNKEFAIRRYHHNFIDQVVIQHPTCFIPKELYENQGVFDKYFKYCGDYEILNRFNTKGVKFKNIDIVLSNFRLSNGRHPQNLVNNEIILIKKRYKFISEKEYKDYKRLQKIKLIYHKFTYPIKNIFKRIISINLF